MTDTTDIAALRDKYELALKDVTDRLVECSRLNFCMDELTAFAALSSTVIDQLEAERQRAAALQGQLDYRNEVLTRAIRQREAAESDTEHYRKAWKDKSDEIAVIKGGRSPKYWAVVSGYSTEFKHSREDAEHYMNNFNGMFIEELFTAPQFPVVPKHEKCHPSMMKPTDTLCTSDERLMQDMSGIVKDGE